MAETHDIATVLDRAPVNAFHLRILVLCTFTLFVDGFDLLAMSAAAPTVSADLGIAPANLGPVLSASLLGAAIGGVAAGPIGDRLGRRPLLIALFLLATVATATTALSRSLETLLVLRLATGLFIGGAIPPALALAAEFMPAARRQFLLIIMVSGAALGSMVGSLLAPTLIALSGWPAIFICGGVLTFLCGASLALGLPESLRFLVLKGKSPEIATATLRRIDSASVLDARQLTVTETHSASVKQLFAGGQAPVTWLLWLVYFGTQAQLYFLGSWLPILFRQAGLPLAVALYGTMAHQGGGVIGSFVFGLWSDRVAPQRVMAWMYVSAIVTIAPLGLVVDNRPLLFLLAVLSGVGAVGAQSCVHAFATSVYPTAVRTTGVGWAVSAGRLGSIVSPLAGGAMLGAGMSVTQILLAVTIVPAICLIGVEALRRVQLARPAISPGAPS